MPFYVGINLEVKVAFSVEKCVFIMALTFHYCFSYNNLNYK